MDPQEEDISEEVHPVPATSVQDTETKLPSDVGPSAPPPSPIPQRASQSDIQSTTPSASDTNEFVFLLEMGFDDKMVEAAKRKFKTVVDTTKIIEWCLSDNHIDEEQEEFFTPEHFTGLFDDDHPAYEQEIPSTVPHHETAENEKKSESIKEQATTPKRQKSILVELQRLFAQLQLTDQRAVSTEKLTKSFGWNGNEAYQQQDVQELNRILFDALERSLQQTSGNNLISRLYRGTLVNKVICLRCNSTTTSYLTICRCQRKGGIFSRHFRYSERIQLTLSQSDKLCDI